MKSDINRPRPHNPARAPRQGLNHNQVRSLEASRATRLANLAPLLIDNITKLDPVWLGLVIGLLAGSSVAGMLRLSMQPASQTMAQQGIFSRDKSTSSSEPLIPDEINTRRKCLGHPVCNKLMTKSYEPPPSYRRQ